MACVWSIAILNYSYQISQIYLHLTLAISEAPYNTLLKVAHSRIDGAPTFSERFPRAPAAPFDLVQGRPEAPPRHAGFVIGLIGAPSKPDPSNPNRPQ